MANNTGVFFNINDNDGIPLVGVSTDGRVFLDPFYGNVGVGVTNPSTKVQIENYGISTKSSYFNASVGISTDIDSFTISSTDFKTLEYMLYFQNGSNIQSQKVLVMQNGSSAYLEEYAIMYEPNQIVSVGATISGGNCKLQVTPETGISGLTTYKFVRGGLL
jgi:hypothetical protein